MNIDPSPVLEKNKRFVKFGRDLHKILSEIDRIPLFDTSFNVLHKEMQRLSDVFDSYMKDRFFDMPDKPLMIHAFHKCLVDCQSTGVHKQVVLTLSKAFEFFGPNLPKVLPLFLSCVFVCMPQSSFQALPDLRVLLWMRILTGNMNIRAVQCVAPGLLSGMLPYVEDQTEGGGKEAVRLLDTIPSKLKEAWTKRSESDMAMPELRPRNFFRAVWQAVRLAPGIRALGLAYLLQHLPRATPFEGARSSVERADVAEGTDAAAPARAAGFEELGDEDGDEAIAAMCAAAHDRSEAVVNKLLEVLALAFALHDDQVISYSQKVALMEGILPLASVNKYSTLSRLFRWMYGGTDLAAAIAYYNVASHQVVQDALHNMVKNHPVAAARSDRIASGEAEMPERTSGAGGAVRSTESSVFDVFVSLQQREEADATFHLLVPKFVETVANYAVTNPRTAQDCIKMFETAPYRIFIEIASTAVRSFIVNDLRSSNMYFVQGFESLMKRVLVLSQCVAAHLAKLGETSGASAVVSTVVEWQAATRLATDIAEVMTALFRLADELEVEALAGMMQQGFSVFDVVVKGIVCVLLQAQREMETTAAQAMEVQFVVSPSSARLTTTTTDDAAGEVEDDLAEDLAAAEAEAAAAATKAQEPPRDITPIHLAIADLVKGLITASSVSKPANDTAAEHIAKTIRTAVATIKLLVEQGRVTDVFAFGTAYHPVTHGMLQLLDDASDAVLTMEAMAYFSFALVDGRSALVEDAADAQPYVLAVALRAWDLLGVRYQQLHVEAVTLLTRLVRWVGPTQQRLAEHIVLQTPENARRFCTLFTILAESEPAAIVDFADGLLALLGAATHAPGSELCRDCQTVLMIREHFLLENGTYLNIVVETLVEVLLVTRPRTPLVASRQWSSPRSPVALFSTLISGICATVQPQQFVARLQRFPPLPLSMLGGAAILAPRTPTTAATGPVPRSPNLTLADDYEAMPHPSLLGSLLVIMNRVVRIEIGARQQVLPEVIDTHHKQWLVNADVDTARSATFLEPITKDALATFAALATGTAYAVADSNGPEVATRACGYIVEEVTDLLTTFIQLGCAGPQPPLLQCLVAALRVFVDATNATTSTASAPRGSVINTAGDAMSPPQRAPSTRLRSPMASKILPYCFILASNGLYQAFAAELTEHTAHCGLALAWSGFMLSLCPIAQSYSAAAAEQLIETHATVVCLLSKHVVTIATARLLQRALDNLRQLLTFFIESAKRSEVPVQRPAPQLPPSSAFFGFTPFFGSNASNSQREITPFMEAMQKIRGAVPSMTDVLVDLFRSLQASTAPPHVKRIVDEALICLLQLLLIHLELPTVERFAINLLQHGRKRVTDSQALANTVSGAAIPAVDKALVRCVCLASRHPDLAGITRTITAIINARKSAGLQRSRASEVEPESAVLYFATVHCLSKDVIVTTDLVDSLRDLSNVVVTSGASNLAYALSLRLITAAISPGTAAGVDLKDPRWSWLSTFNAKVISVVGERASLESEIANVIQGAVQTIGSALWAKDAETIVRAATGLMRDRLLPAMEASSMRHDSHVVNMLAMLLTMLDSSAKTLELSHNLRTVMIPEALFKDTFFRMSRSTTAAWRKVFGVITGEKAVFDSLMAKATATSLVKLTTSAANHDSTNRGNHMKRLAFVTLASPFRTTDLRTKLPALRTFMHESFRQFSKHDGGFHESARHCFLLFRVVLFKTPQAMRAKVTYFWSIVIPEIVKILNMAAERLRADGALPPALQMVAVEVLKTIDLAMVLTPNELHPLRWLFVDDAELCTSQSYTPLLLHLASIRGGPPAADCVDGKVKLKMVRLVVANHLPMFLDANGDDVAPARPLFALPSSTQASVEVDLRTLAAALAAYSASIETGDTIFYVDEDDANDCSSQGLNRRDDAVDVSYIDWLLESDFMTTPISAIAQGSDTRSERVDLGATATELAATKPARPASSVGDVESHHGRPSVTSTVDHLRPSSNDFSSPLAQQRTNPGRQSDPSPALSIVAEPEAGEGQQGRSSGARPDEAVVTDDDTDAKDDDEDEDEQITASTFHTEKSSEPQFRGSMDDGATRSSGEDAAAQAHSDAPTTTVEVGAAPDAQDGEQAAGVEQQDAAAA